MTLQEARAALDELGLEVRVLRVTSEQPRGAVVRQTPEAGVALERGQAVTLFVSRGAAAEEAASTVSVPDIVGLSASAAAGDLREAGLTPRVRLVDSSQQSGVVLRQSPAAGTEIDSGTEVRLDVSRNRPPAVPTIEVPDVRGLVLSEARSQLRSLGLTVNVTRTPSPEPAGTVLRQSPRAGTDLRKGGAVTLTVSTGPALVDVPDVTGLDEESARLELEAAGFQVRVTDEPTTDPAQDGVVVRQSPTGGSGAKDGAVVTLVVARYA
jgi:serine/threonine-protein kinase